MTLQRVFLHPGPPKTGTTYLQSLLYANAEAFGGQGVTVVGSQAAHYRAANELLRRKARRGVVVPAGAWTAVREQVLAAPGHAVMSCERYSMLHTRQARRIVEELPGHELHLVLTLRDIAAVLPARWQEQVKNGGSRTWAQFLDEATQNPGQLRRWTRASLCLDAWSRVLPPERIHVVTVPPSSAPRSLLLERFCAVLGVDPGQLPTLEPPRANPSLDLVGTELVRRLNALPAARLSPHAQHSEIKAHLVRQLPTRADRRPALTAEAFAAARAESEHLVRRVTAGGFPVVGDLSELTASRPPTDDRHNVDVDRDELVDIAAVAISILAKRSARRGRQLARLAKPSSPSRPQRVRLLLRRFSPRR